MASAGTMATGGCGRCCDKCRVAEDAFDRADAAELGSPWDERAGDIGIVGNKASTEDSDTLAIHENAISRNVAGTAPGVFGMAWVTVGGDTVGDQTMLVIGYDDDDNFWYVLWEFDTGESYISLWEVDSGVHTQLRGPYTVCERGSDVETRLRVCISPSFINAYVVDPDTDEELLKIRAAVGIGGAGFLAGIGTKDVTGTVTFNDFRYERIEFHNAACPDCEQCPFCPDDQELCFSLNLTGFGDLVGDYRFVRTSLVDDGEDGGGPFDPTGSRNCFWLPDPDLHPELDSTVIWVQKADDGHYYLWVVLGGACGLFYKADLGTCPPDCSTFNCITEFSIGFIVGGPECEDPGGTLTVTSGECPEPYYYGDAYYYCNEEEDPLPEGDETCCEERDPMPDSLFATLVALGVTIATDLELTREDPPPIGLDWQYTGTIASHPQGCDTAVQMFCDSITKLAQIDFFAKNASDTCVLNQVVLRIISCDPFHAVPEPDTDPDDIWDDLEVIE
jgi:hypothetical protein